MLTDRRVALGWFRRSAFVTDHADRLRNDRTIAAIEKTERMNFSRETLALVEILYQWKPGSIDAVLAGREPSPVEDAVVVHEPPPAAPVSEQRMECRFIIERLREDQLPEALRVLRGMERSEG